MIDKNTIYSYFQTDDFPTEEQFRATWDSFWHKSESIPMSSISGLNQMFQQTATFAQLNNKANVDGSNIDVSAYQEKLNITNLIATAKEEVKTELLNGAPEAFDTLKEISDWISDDETAEAAILQAIQNEATARTNADNLKLDKPTITSNSAFYPYVIGEDGNGNSARLPAGDLGKNFFNSDLSNTTARNHTMNASVTVNTLGNPYSITGLPNKNADITNFRKVRVQNASGLDAVVDSKNLLTDGVTSMTDAEKDAWRLAQRKSTETYSTGVPVINGVYPYIQSKENVSFLNFNITGSSLLINVLNPQTKILFTRTHDINGQSVSEPKYDATGNVNISLITANNISLEVPAVNLNTGKYVVEVVHNNLTSLVTSEFYIHTSIIQQSLPAMTIAQSLGSTSQYLQESTLGTNNTIDAFMFKTSEILNMANYPNGVVIDLNITLFTKQYAGNSHIGYVYLSSTADAITASPAIGALGISYTCNGNNTYWTEFGTAGGQGGSFPLTIIIKGGYAQLVTTRLGYVQVINKSNIFNGGISLNIGTGGFNIYTSPIFKVSLVSIKKITN